MQQTVSIIISGKVQGVFFRQSTKEKALELGLTGKVSNLPDGTVHIVATGSPDALELLSAWCQQGPPKANVFSVTIEKLPLQVFEKFMIDRFK
ncbi:acylphosphatase [Chitinophagaceae bacterium IBVUCB2]|nr:acylphosphatase [Chitinophagaceae bacterium IBVUCB2]